MDDKQMNGGYLGGGIGVGGALQQQRVSGYDYDGPLCATEKSSPVTSARKALAQSLALLQDALSGLEGRLEPVLSPAPPQAGNGGTDRPTPCASRVAVEFTQAAQVVSIATDRVNRLLARLEL